MEIIEKQVEKVKEVPADGYYGYGRRDIYYKYFIYINKASYLSYCRCARLYLPLHCF